MDTWSFALGLGSGILVSPALFFVAMIVMGAIDADRDRRL